MSENKKESKEYTEEKIKSKRKFPVLNTVILIILVAIQITVLTLAICYEPKPRDIINEYKVTVVPKSDGTLDIEYYFEWTALDENEPLTWVEIGIPNENASIYSLRLSNDTIKSAKVESYDDGDYTYVRIDFREEYIDGEQVVFSFVINQKNMLCESSDACIYEFVPSWFNSVPVEHYEFKWYANSSLKDSNADRVSGNWHIWEGEMPCGTYTSMRAVYDRSCFEDARKVSYSPFYDGDVVNELNETKFVFIFLAALVTLVLLVIEIMIIDSYVSYCRGRGFLSGYGHRMHTYGVINPRYRRARAHHIASSSSRGGGGGGCACACACACAGGGRAGCSQKDTYKQKKQ